MQGKPYTLYRSSRFVRPLRFERKPGGESIATGRSTAACASVSAIVATPSVMDKRPVSHRLMKWVTTLAMIAGLGLVLYAGWVFGYGYIHAKMEQDQLRSFFSISGNGSVDPGYLSRESSSLNARLAHLDPVGEINIPGIGVRWMVVQGSDDAALAKGPGHIEETSHPGAGGNFAVAGDRVLYGAPFLKLDEVKTGDEIRVRMPYATFLYKVRETFIVTPDDVSVLQPPGYESITLLTCDPPWDIKQRIVVRGELTAVQPAGTEI